MELLLDNNLPPSFVRALNDVGFAALHVREIGHRDSADMAIMRIAQERGAVVLTQDNDFPQLLALSRVLAFGGAFAERIAHRAYGDRGSHSALRPFGPSRFRRGRGGVGR